MNKLPTIKKSWKGMAPDTLAEWEDYKKHGAFITSLSTREIDILLEAAMQQGRKEIAKQVLFSNMQNNLGTLQLLKNLEQIALPN